MTMDEQHTRRTRLVRVVSHVSALAVGAGLGLVGPVGTAAAVSPLPPTIDRETLPRTVITTDGELDDMNSFTRFLYYTNEIDVDGIVYSSSVHHWKGDGVHTLSGAQDAGIITSFRGQTAGTPEHSRDATTWRWNPDPWIEDKISKYGEILPNLRQHDPNYPSAEELLAKVAVGNVNFENDFSADTPGSDLIKEVLLDDDERDVWLQAWGGQNTIARALKSIEEEYEGTPEWPSIRNRVIDKAVIATIGNQDNAYADYIGPSWPEIRVFNWGFTFTAWGGFKDNTRIPQEIKSYYKHPFFTEHIWEHGPLLEDFHLIGDGRYLNGESDAPGWQPGLAGVVYDLETWRMWDFLGPYEKYDMVSEGDTPAFLPLIDNGLRFLDDPTLGSWGGRFAPSPSNPTQFSPQGDYNPVTGSAEPAYSLYRWVPDAQDDFAARADWGVTSFDEANHAPVVSLSDEDLTATPGSTVKVRSLVRDPDGDDVTREWSVYTEASTVDSEPAIRLAGQGTAQNAFITVPADANPGERIVLTLIATDDGTHSLTGYAQVVITIE
ncbi:DUF1593 domain-containing protein [Isoptericola variabilis]|uniref:DUF1593 domain-containing protein n=1 Tax=Isoptericola variabilis (strain 225) TaxID=743718 RepID=F6FVZ7_ISOV2|nr:DUF1593 domain-containing protein [Isoptericola variabilis]AEG44467.1 protein of unknown function DUF1593 [Isoptericola variabilis 225]TWH26620.1 uncharacterized protein DUF1593 [Isoptericola variabilis J7]